MYHTVVMVALPVQQIFEPIAQRIFGICVLAAIYMQAPINTNEQVPGVAKLIAAVGSHQKIRNKMVRVFSSIQLLIPVVPTSVLTYTAPKMTMKAHNQ